MRLFKVFRLLVLASLVGFSDVNAQEAAAAHDSVHTDTSAIAISMDAKNTAIVTVLQKLTACNAVGAFYRPDQADADPVTGCWMATTETAGNYYFASCLAETNLGEIVAHSVLTPASAWPSGFSVNHSVVQSDGVMPAGNYEAMGYCKKTGATLWRKVD